MTDYDGPDYEDWDDEIMHHGKEEPDCYSCSDAGCPACGYVDPANPEHLREVAMQILHARIPVVPRGVNDVQIPFPDLPAEAVATVRELVATARIYTDIKWPDPATTDESPF